MVTPQRDHHAVLTELRDAIRRIERRPARRDGVVASGLAEVDAVLPGGGFPRGALAELTGGPASGKVAVALALFAALPPEDLVAFVDGRGELYPPAAAARGVDLGRLLLVRPAPAGAGRGEEAAARAALWAAEALLASGAFAAVAVDAPPVRMARGADAVARRLQAAAEKGGAIGLWLAVPGSALRVPAAVRLELTAPAGRIVARRTTSRGAPGAPSPSGLLRADGGPPRAGGGVPARRAGGGGRAS